MRRPACFGVLQGLIVLMATATLFAQANHGPAAASAAGEAPLVFRSETSVVSLGVTVTDKAEHQIRGLEQENFVVFEDGRPQAVRFFAADPTPLDLAIVLDTSASMGAVILDAQEAALELAAALRPGDRASFSEVKRTINELHPLSADTANLSRAILATAPAGSTALYDAIYVTLRSLQRAATTREVRRQALVVLSDGEDTSSMMKYDDMLDVVQRSGVTVYAVSLRRPGASRPDRSRSRLLMGDSVTGDFVLRSLAEQTGGLAFFGLASKDLARTGRQIASELATQYSLGYVSSNPRNDGRYRQVSVRVLTPAGVVARTRPGYFAASTSTHARSEPGGMRPDRPIEPAVFAP